MNEERKNREIFTFFTSILKKRMQHIKLRKRMCLKHNVALEKQEKVTTIDFLGRTTTIFN